MLCYLAKSNIRYDVSFTILSEFIEKKYHFVYSNRNRTKQCILPVIAYSSELFFDNKVLLLLAA